MIFMPVDESLSPDDELDKLPTEIFDFIFDADDKDTVRLFNEAGFSKDQSRAVNDLVNRIYVRMVPVADFYRQIVDKIGLPVDRAKKFALDFIGCRFLPIDDFLGGEASAALFALGGESSAYTGKRIIIRDMRPQEVVTEFLHEHPVNIPAFLEHRLREILESRVRDVRKDAETITRLTRAEKIGGVELPQQEAEDLVEALAAKIASIKIAPDFEPKPVTPPVVAETKEEPVQTVDTVAPVVIEKTPTPIPVTVSRPTTVAAAQIPGKFGSKKGDSVMPEDEHEADAIRARVLPHIVTESLFDLGESIKKGIETVFTTYGATLPSFTKDRFRAIITSRLKDIRDQAETEDLLVRDVAKGGMGFGSDLAERVLRAIEEQVKIIHNKRDETVKSEKDAFVKQTIVNTYTKDESRKKGDIEELDRMYSSLTGKVAQNTAQNPPATPMPQTPAPIPKPPVVGTAPVAPKPAPNIAIPKPAVSPVVPLTPPKPFVAPAPTPVAPPPTYKMPTTPLPSVAPSTLPGTRMQDVRPVSAAARLTGPAEELKNMTLIDFRRLSTDPVEACRKINDKLDILEEHSYSRRIEGVQAWLQSPVNKLYLQVITSAFRTGKPISNVIGENQAANRETLTEREVRAIMDLNKGLKA